MSPVAARLRSRPIRFAPPPAARATGLQPRCYFPKQSEIRAHGARLILRRTAMTMVEVACIGVFLAGVWVWAAIGASIGTVG
jgi:hypothetical protein